MHECYTRPLTDCFSCINSGATCTGCVEPKYLNYNITVCEDAPEEYECII